MKGELAGVAELVRERTGITLPPARAAALRGALFRIAPNLDAAGFIAATADPEHGPELVERLIDEVTVQETSFVRDRSQLDPIPWQRLHRDAGGTIRVWSAGCASGEEAYTLALLATEAFRPTPPPVDVLGTDISSAALAAAAAGHYRERAVRGLTPGLRRRYLEFLNDGSYLVGEHLRTLVRFRQHNLVSDPAPPRGEPSFHLVVCRNVLIYFETSVAGRVVRRLEGAVCRGGMMVLGAADALQRTAALGTAPDSQSRMRAPARGMHTATKQVTKAILQPASVSPSARPASRPKAPPAPERDAAEPGCSRDERLRAALAAAGRGDRAGAYAGVASLLAEDPMDADAHFVQGLVMMEEGRAADAADALRRALYTDPSFALAAFSLGRAYDALGDWAAARRAYGQALRTLNPHDRRHEPMLQQVDLSDIAVACRERLKGGQ